VARAITVGDHDTISRAAKALAPNCSSSAAMEMVRAGQGGVQALMVSLSALRDVRNAEMQLVVQEERLAHINKKRKVVERDLLHASHRLEIVETALASREKAICKAEANFKKLADHHHDVMDREYELKMCKSTARTLDELRSDRAKLENTIELCSKAKVEQNSVLDNLVTLRDLEMSVAECGFSLSVEDNNGQCVFGPSFDAFVKARTVDPKVPPMVFWPGRGSDGGFRKRKYT
jgi:hypothetical protein